MEPITHGLYEEGIRKRLGSAMTPNAYMDSLFILLMAMLVIVFASGIVLSLRCVRRPDRPFARWAIVRERIRREVQQEFEEPLRQSSGVRRWWLVLRREAEISRRHGRVIHY